MVMVIHDSGQMSNSSIIAKNDNGLDDLVDLDSAKVDKTIKINNKVLTGDIVLNKTDIGLGNVENYAATLVCCQTQAFSTSIVHQSE